MALLTSTIACYPSLFKFTSDAPLIQHSVGLLRQVHVRSTLDWHRDGFNAAALPVFHHAVCHEAVHVILEVGLDARTQERVVHADGILAFFTVISLVLVSAVCACP